MDSNLSTTQPDQGRFYVYVHCRADDGEPFYVGKGTKARAWNKAGRSAWWKRIVAKHGLIVKIQKHFQDESEAFASEVETIAILRDLGYELCNMTDGGEGASGYVHDVETRAKMSVAKSSHEARLAAAENMAQMMVRYWSDPRTHQAIADHMRRYWDSQESRVDRIAGVVSKIIAKDLAKEDAPVLVSAQEKRLLEIVENWESDLIQPSVLAKLMGVDSNARLPKKLMERLGIVSLKKVVRTNVGVIRLAALRNAKAWESKTAAETREEFLKVDSTIWQEDDPEHKLAEMIANRHPV